MSRRWILRALPLAAFALAACAGPPRFSPAAPTGDQLAELRAYYEVEPTDVDGRIEYGRALVAAEDWDGVLELTGEDAPEDHQTEPRIQVLRGVALEESGELEAASDVYTSVLANAEAQPLHPDVEARLFMVNDRILQAEARAAVAREDQLAGVTPSGSTLAVMPFRVSSVQPGFAPLGRAFAEFLITDLAIAERFQVLERVRVQALVDELSLGEAGLAEPSSAARSGRLLGAGNLVQGTLTLTTERVRGDAAVVEVRPGDPGVNPFTREEAVQELMALEGRIALDILADLGVQLTPAEEALILGRPAVSLEAMLAFGRGLEAYDRGDYETAEAEFADAVALDSNLAVVRAEQFRLVGAGVVSNLRLTDDALRGVLQRRAIDALRTRTLGSRANVLRVLGEDTDRIPLTDASGAERVAPTAVFIELLFRRPGV